MPFLWEDNLVLAKELAARTDEAALRCAIGRAYYAVFGIARTRWIEENGSIPLGVQVHNFIWSEYRRGNRLRQFIGKDGFLLLNYRNQADYEPDFPALATTVQRALLIAEKTLNNLNAL